MRNIALVAVGAAVGALVRRIMSIWSPEASAFPWGTLFANLTGCAVIGWCAGRLDRESPTWLFLVTGVLGGLTTASTFAAETRSLVTDGRPLIAAGYVLASSIGGLGVAAVVRRLATDRRTAALR